MFDGSNPLTLAAALTRRTEQLCIGLEQGIADIYELVTPVTAELLRWWFGEDACQARTFNFHPGQRQAILNVIVAHEVLDSPNLKDLYEQVCADALLEGTRLADVAQGKHGHPKYCLKMATGTGKTWVLQALLVWQLLNKTAALEEGPDDPRFTRRFLIVAPGLIVYERLLDAFLGKENEDKSRDFASSDIASYAELFTPPARRERIAQFVRNNVCQKQEIGLKAAMRLGLVKSLVLNKRKEVGALALEFKAERDTDGNVCLSEGQRVMLRAGLQKLRKLAADFARLDATRHPKMLVVCEDTAVAPLVAQFLRDEGLHDGDVLTVDSGRKAELGEKQWAPLRQRRLSEVTKLVMRESASLEVSKCIYTRLPYPTRSGGLERAFIEWAQLDAGVEAFCKISENRHDFVRLRYIKDDGLPALYIPDFLVRTADAIYLVETKAQQQVGHPNVQRKLRAATTWCERINALEPERRGGRRWHYALIGESLFYDWRGKGARLSELLAFSRARAVSTAQSQGDLAL